MNTTNINSLLISDEQNKTLAITILDYGELCTWEAIYNEYYKSTYEFLYKLDKVNKDTYKGKVLACVNMDTLFIYERGIKGKLELNLPNLKYLSCYNNSITSLGEYPNLKYLYCSNNSITSLGEYPNLKYLSCYNTSLPYTDIEGYRKHLVTLRSI